VSKSKKALMVDKSNIKGHNTRLVNRFANAQIEGKTTVVVLNESIKGAYVFREKTCGIKDDTDMKHKKLIVELVDLKHELTWFDIELAKKNEVMIEAIKRKEAEITRLKMPAIELNKFAWDFSHWIRLCKIDKVHTWIYENIFSVPNGGIFFFLYLREYFTMLLGTIFPFSKATSWLY
jgi:hypothetical protein